MALTHCAYCKVIPQNTKRNITWECIHIRNFLANRNLFRNLLVNARNIPIIKQVFDRCFRGMCTVSSGMICGGNWVICVGEAGDGISHTHLSAYDVTKTYVVGDDYQRHRWQCTTSLVPLLKLYRIEVSMKVQQYIHNSILLINNLYLLLPLCYFLYIFYLYCNSYLYICNFLPILYPMVSYVTSVD